LIEERLEELNKECLALLFLSCGLLSEDISWVWAFLELVFGELLCFREVFTIWIFLYNLFLVIEKINRFGVTLNVLNSL
jgi:hypothetical protein